MSARQSITPRAVLGRLTWGLVDQAVSSLTNFAVGLFVARGLGAVDFGIFALAWATYGAALNISRGLASDPFVVRFSGARVHLARSAGQGDGHRFLVGLATGLLRGRGDRDRWCRRCGVHRARRDDAVPAPARCWRFGFFAAGRAAKPV